MALASSLNAKGTTAGTPPMSGGKRSHTGGAAVAERAAEDELQIGRARRRNTPTPRSGDGSSPVSLDDQRQPRSRTAVT